MSWFTNLFSSGSSSGSGSSGWSALGGALLAGVSAYSSSRSNQRATEDNNKNTLQNTAAQGAEARRTAAYDRALDEYYSKKRALEKRNALDTYSAFSHLKNYAPSGYALPAKPIVPSMPSG